MKSPKINAWVFIVFILSSSSAVFAWNDTVTHPNMTEAAIARLKLNGWLVPYFQNNLGFKNHVDELLNNGEKDIKIIDLLLEGAKEEDAPDEDHRLTRSSNHFHSPLKSTNEAGLDQGDLLQGESAFDWARGDSDSNEYSWLKARESYSAALSTNIAAIRDAKLALTFGSLGQVMHLIQDMAVPAHTRNDMQGAGRVSVA